LFHDREAIEIYFSFLENYCLIRARNFTFGSHQAHHTFTASETRWRRLAKKEIDKIDAAELDINFAW